MDITILKIEEHKMLNLVMIITDQTMRNMFLVTKQQPVKKGLTKNKQTLGTNKYAFQVGP